MQFRKLEDARRSIGATLNEIDQTEHDLAERGIDVRDENEWQQLRDIVRRIERRLNRISL
jgi:hypothetical protein